MKIYGLSKSPGRSARLSLTGVYLWAAFFAFGLYLPAVSDAQINTPTVADGKYLGPNEAPCIPYLIDRTTGTTQVAVRTSGPGYVSWVMLSTAPADATGYIVLRDTGSVVNGSGGAIGYLGGNLFAQSNTANTMITFQPPARFVNGVTAQQSLAGMSATVCTRLYGTQSP